MNNEERAVAFQCRESWLYGILHVPEHIGPRGVLIVVGGPQYRVGSHRQFTLLARHLAANGIPAMRFDCRGMGDSEGEPRTFEDMEEDVRSAIDTFLEEVPTLEDLVIWGLCDAASAALFYAHRDERVTGLVLLNPWVRTDHGAAKVYLKHYYMARLLQPDLWNKIRQGKFSYGKAIGSLSQIVGSVLKEKKERMTGGNADNGEPHATAPLPERMLAGLSRFNGKTLLILSGNDLTAQEFSDLVKGSAKWQRLLSSPAVSRQEIPEANHTFSRQKWKDQVVTWTSAWIRSRI
ncbi:MAG: hydrolase 1, exosortase A system-associated [Nitrosospira sp.]|nr:hydrolase 1, exosortase A system-associated [Nitrosospira sp.]